jgi:DNA sulfur modification protein DndD
MILTQIVLENFGLFSGRNEFDLRPNKPRPGRKTQRPIILFGGKNGSGKTTFLGAMRLLLYGKQSFDGKISQAGYEKALIGHLHRSQKAATKARYAKLGLEFEYQLNGEKCIFYVERSWELISAESIKESFIVQKDGLEFTDVGKLHWEAFIADIIPARLSQLFFFDGEKIKSIAEDLSSNAAIAEAIQSLLGLDHVIALKSDLKIHRSRILQKSGNTDHAQSLKEIEEKIIEVVRERTVLDEKRAEFETKKDGVNLAITSLEAEIASKGGGFAVTRQANKERADAIENKLIQVKSQIRSLADSALPFALAPKTRKLLVKQIKQESAANSTNAARNTAIEIKEHLLREAADIKPKLKGIDSFITSSIANYQQSLEGVAADGIHGFGDLKGLELTRLLTTDAETSRDAMKKALDELDELEFSLSEVNRDLEKAPAEDDLSKLLEKLRNQSAIAGGIQQKLDELDIASSKNTNLKSQLERDQLKLEETISADSKRTQMMTYIEKLGPALDLYKKRLTQSKIDALRGEVTECFNRLARKSDFVHSIDIDAETFSVTLLDHHHRAIPREDLSSGEKQIFAIAMLWGLARTSGRSLPVVIDTPLGRLDSDHRKKLVTEYFPNASHQVILLSTDTEVDQTLYKDLQPNISESYHLVYNNSKGCTSAEAGFYFWNTSLSSDKNLAPKSKVTTK